MNGDWETAADWEDADGALHHVHCDGWVYCDQVAIGGHDDCEPPCSWSCEGCA